MIYRPQLLDVIAAAQTMEGHAAVLEAINFETNGAIDSAERYLQVLALATNPSEILIRGIYLLNFTCIVALFITYISDVLKLVGVISHPKLHETALLSLAALTRTFVMNSNDPANAVTPAFILSAKSPF